MSVAGAAAKAGMRGIAPFQARAAPVRLPCGDVLLCARPLHSGRGDWRAHEQAWFLKDMHMTPAEARLRIARDGLMWLHVIECSLIA